MVEIVCRASPRFVFGRLRSTQRLAQKAVHGRTSTSGGPADLPKIVDIVLINRAAGSLALDHTGTWHHWGDDSLRRWKAILPHLRGVRHLDAYQKGDDFWIVGLRQDS